LDNEQGGEKECLEKPVGLSPIKNPNRKTSGKAGGGQRKLLDRIWGVLDSRGKSSIGYTLEARSKLKFPGKTPKKRAYKKIKAEPG